VRFVARYILLNPFKVSRDSSIEIRGRIISKISSLKSPAKAIDLGDAVIVPGLVNAHCHLGLSNLQGLIPASTFVQWMPRLINLTRTWGPRDWEDSIRKGLKLLRENGVTSVGEICRHHFLINFLKDDPLRKVVFLEVVGTRVLGPLLERLIEGLKRFRATSTFRLGLSPHAPYSVHTETYQAIYREAQRCGYLIATHLSETKEEVCLLRSARGPFVKILKELGQPLPFLRPPKVSPVRYLDQLGILGPQLNAVHCNYLFGQDITLLTKSRTKVIFCPRSHEFFGHDRHPLRRLVAEGVPVALGTDSLASNSELSILREMALVRTRYRLDPRLIIWMATLSGAQALFPGSKLGVLRKGYLADLIAVEVPQGLPRSEVPEYLCSGMPRVKLTVVDGKIVFRS
jgi:cytosine/adenosine deaminase-related metal-dependent hydrolase